MIYIISGASRSGKSIASRKLMDAIYTPYVPVDSLMMGFMNGVPSLGVHDKLWPHEIAGKIWPFLRACCENMISNHIDYIFEGEAFLPEKVRELMDKYPEQIKACFIGYSETEVSRKANEVKSHPNHKEDWLLNQSDDSINQHIQNMINYSIRIKAQCETTDIAYFDTSMTFEPIINEVIKFFTK